MSTRSTSLMTVVLACAAVPACDSLESPAPIAVAAAEEHRPTYVDSILPIEEEIARFRQQVGQRVTTLADGAGTREELVRRYVDALEARDPSDLNRLVITPAEFIDLYYPHTRFVSRPYELAPQHVWFQLENYGSKGLSRAMDRFGGRPLEYRGHRCETEEELGPNRIAGGCVVDVLDASGNRQWVALLGQVLERDGRHKFVSLANGL
jgi:hypothetical protein